MSYSSVTFSYYDISIENYYWWCFLFYICICWEQSPKLYISRIVWAILYNLRNVLFNPSKIRIVQFYCTERDLHLIFIQNCTWQQRCTRFLYHVRKFFCNCLIVSRRVIKKYLKNMNVFVRVHELLITVGEWVVALEITQQIFFLAQASIGLTSLCAVTHYKSLPSCERWLGALICHRHTELCGTSSRVKNFVGQEAIWLGAYNWG